MLHQLPDVATGADCKLSPLATFLACYALFELHTQGFAAACAVFSKGVRLFRGAAVAVGRASVGATRREAAADTVAAVTAALGAWADPDTNPWLAGLATVGKQSGSALLHSDVGVDPDFSLLFPLDASHSSGAAADYYLYNCEWLYCVWVTVARVQDARSPVSPRVHRSLLEEALSTFPANSGLLALYTAPTRNILHSSVRVRQFLDRFIALPDCPATIWAHLLFSELRRASADGGGGPEMLPVLRVRRLFEQAVTNASGARMLLLWRMYARFELVSGNALGARKVLFRGVNACPWAKAVWTDVVRRFRPYVSREECVELMRVMAGKGIRVRAPLHV